MVKRWLCPLILATIILPNIAAGTGCTSAEAVSGCTEDSGNGGALFRFSGKEFHESDLNIQVRERLHQLASKYYQERRLLMDSAVWQIYLTREAERQQKEPEQVAMEMINLVQPTEEAMSSFYEANKEKISAPYDQVKRQISQFLMQQQALEERSKLVESIKKEGEYAFLIDKPQPPVATIDTAGFPSKGPMLAPVEVVEFADYQCPHCKTASEILQRLETQYGEKIRVVFMDFPINRSGISLKVAEGAVCADQQGKFWVYHYGAFELQSSLSASSPLDLANKIGLDTARFNDCLTGTEAAAKVAKSKAEALRLGLDSTPTFFVNGIRLNAATNLENELSEAIEKALKETGS
ncbi:MAG: thioredoxin domain-containing protein [Gammaproteobacteria bacterium]|nr:thioredoxin domain-containing protein [Gammaproteobacteria bacterium]